MRMKKINLKMLWKHKHKRKKRGEAEDSAVFRSLFILFSLEDSLSPVFLSPLRSQPHTPRDSLTASKELDHFSKARCCSVDRQVCDEAAPASSRTAL
jgi:hypothetical protein